MNSVGNLRLGSCTPGLCVCVVGGKSPASERTWWAVTAEGRAHPGHSWVARAQGRDGLNLSALPCHVI